jgi:lipopolysaccharide transport system ATP-binding protein
MSKAEMDRKFDAIVDFSGVEKFIDTPVKRYSSGMQVRLAFSVAAHLEPEILLVDEVLAVGDAAFQKKCIGKMGEVAQVGRTVLFVSHNMEAIRGLCQRGIWFKDGMIQVDGNVEDVVQAYMNSLIEGSFYYENKDYGLVIQRVVLKNAKGEETTQFCPGEDLIVEIQYNAHKRIEKPYVLLIVQGAWGYCFMANMLLDGRRPHVFEGQGFLKCKFKSIPLLPQSYTIRMGIRAKDGKDLIMDYHDVASFNVAGDLENYGYRGEYQAVASRTVSVVVPHEWILPDGTVAAVGLSLP